MIYTVISTVEKNKIQQNKDCRFIRQSLSLLPEKVEKYVENTKNESVKQERRLAYSTLFCSIKAFFNLDEIEISRTENGKPYIKNSDISISLSHSDGVIAICISDGDDVGIDIQSEIDPERQKRLENRFFTDYEMKNEKIPTEYYFCSFSGDEAIFESIAPDVCDTDGFSAKWSAAESVMKLNGGGFGDITSLARLAEESRTDIREIILNKKYYLAISVKEN